jgi:hypothetical protein
MRLGIYSHDVSSREGEVLFTNRAIHSFRRPASARIDEVVLFGRAVADAVLSAVYEGESCDELRLDGFVPEDVELFLAADAAYHRGLSDYSFLADASP